MAITFQTSLFDDPELLGAASAEPSTGARPAEPLLGPLGDRVERISLGEGAWLDIRPPWVGRSDELFERLVDRVEWQADRREMYDRVVEVPRLVSWFGPGTPLPDPVLAEAREALNDHYGRPPGQVFETAGLCFYRTGDDSIAWHGDRVGAAIDRDTMVAIVSVGAERVLAVRSRAAGEVRRFPLGHGDLLVMGGSTQRTHEHSIAKTKRAVGPRISVQLRPVWPR